MRIAIICNDTRGGVQPYVALGQGLARAEHDVRAVAPADLAPLFAAAGIPVAPLSFGGAGALQAATGIAEQGTIASMRFMARTMPALVQTSTRETLTACAGVDLLTGGVGGMVIGLSVAEKLGVPFVPTHLQPLGAPTGDYPGILLAHTPGWLGRPGRRLSHTLSEAGLWLLFRRPMGAARREVLGLTGRPRAADGQPTLYGFSRAVVDVPPGTPPRHVTGYWTLPPDPAWSPPLALAAFLARGGPVVSVGFGSMASQDAEAVTALVRGAARDAGVRAVLLAGWGASPRRPPTPISSSPTPSRTSGFSRRWRRSCITAGLGRPARGCAPGFLPSSSPSGWISPSGAGAWRRSGSARPPSRARASRGSASPPPCTAR